MNRRQASGKRQGFWVLAAALLVGGCGRVVVLPDQPQVLLRESERQTLVVQNTGDLRVALRSCTPGGPEISLVPGESTEIGFRVLSIMDIEHRSGQPWFVPAGSSVNYLKQTGETCYVQHEGLDAVLTLGFPDATSEIIRLSINGCPEGGDWVDVTAPPARHEVGTEVMPGVPFSLCPP